MLNGIIAKANGRDKVIDFRDGLVLADIDDYAMIHGVGGKHHTMNSVIKIGLCDYTAGTGSKSKTVFASITPDICEQLFEVCKQNLGTTVYDNSFPALKEQRTANRKMMKFADMGVDVLMKVVTILTRATTAADKGTAPSAVEVAKGLNKLLSKTQERVMAKENYEDPACLTTLRRVDFQYTQDRVHSKKMGADGYAPVQRLQIFHQTYVQGHDFDGCQNIETITMPSNLQYIESHTFSNCFALRNIYYTGSTNLGTAGAPDAATSVLNKS